MDENKKIEINKSHWNKAFKDFKGWCALPTWGPFEVCRDDETLIGEIKDKIFLEICCGSGHSINYLVNKGAKKVYGLDFSEEQLKLSSDLNKDFILDEKVVLLNQSMEDSIDLPEQVDVAFSIYGMPWTVNPQKTLKNIFNSLKPGGKFVWSWDHKLFLNSSVKNGPVTVDYDYHEDEEIQKESNSIKDSNYNITFRKTSTWFYLLREAGFEVSKYLEPEPLNLNEDIANISSPEMASYYDLEKVRKIPCVIVFECIKPIK